MYVIIKIASTLQFYKGRLMPKSKGFYSYAKFCAVCKKMEFKNRRDYEARRKDDPRLPSGPNDVYGKDWDNAGKWASITGKEISRVKGEIYNLSEFCLRAKELGLNSMNYGARYKEDNRLPSVPRRVYGKEWEAMGQWSGIGGKEIVPLEHRTFKRYLPFSAFLLACTQMKFTCQDDYHSRYKEMDGLPSSPPHVYGEEWKTAKGWRCVKAWGNTQTQ
jgi:hypothetical protein